MPEPLVSALASRRSRPVSVLPLRGARARRVHARLATIMIAPVRSPARWSRSRTVFSFTSRCGSPFCDSLPPRCSWSRSCSLTLRCSSLLAPILTERRSRLLHLRPPCDDRYACIRARLAMITCVSLTRSPFGARARSTFVKNLDRTSPFFHVRSPHGARTLPTSMLDRGDAHIAVIVSRRSCSRSRVRSPPLGVSFHARLASVLHPSCLRSFELLLRCSRPPASCDAKRRARLLGGCARVRLATFAFALTFGSRRRSFTLDSRAHARLTTCTTASTSRERPSTFASVLTSRFLLAKETLALTSVMAVVDRLATIPRDHFRRLTVHGRAIYVSRFRRTRGRAFRPVSSDDADDCPFGHSSTDDEVRFSFDRIAFGRAHKNLAASLLSFTILEPLSKPAIAHHGGDPGSQESARLITAPILSRRSSPHVMSSIPLRRSSS